MKPGLRMVAGLARVRRLDAKVRRLVRAAYYDEVSGMVLTDLGAYSADELRDAFESVAPGATVVGIGDNGTLRVAMGAAEYHRPECVALNTVAAARASDDPARLDWHASRQGVTPERYREIIDAQMRADEEYAALRAPEVPLVDGALLDALPLARHALVMSADTRGGLSFRLPELPS